MAEEKYDVGTDGGMKIQKGRFGLWFENFWYHYKWHTIITIFVILVVTICTAQMCSKEEYDVHIIYAGSENIRGQKKENDLSMYETIYKSLNEAVEDFDGNGKAISSFEPLYMLTAAEIAEAEKEIADLKANGEGSYTLSYAQLNENKTTFKDRTMYSDTYVFLISESLYKEYQTTEYDVPMFVSIKGLVDEGVEVQFFDDAAVYLHSTEFGKLPGLCDLPENTLIALRSKGALSSHFNKNDTDEFYANAEKVIKNMLNYAD